MYSAVVVDTWSPCGEGAQWSDAPYMGPVSGFKLNFGSKYRCWGLTVCISDVVVDLE